MRQIWDIRKHSSSFPPDANDVSWNKPRASGLRERIISNSAITSTTVTGKYIRENSTASPKYFLALFVPFNGEWRKDNARERVNSSASFPRRFSAIRKRFQYNVYLTARILYSISLLDAENLCSRDFISHQVQIESEKQRERARRGCNSRVYNLASFSRILTANNQSTANRRIYAVLALTLTCLNRWRIEINGNSLWRALLRLRWRIAIAPLALLLSRCLVGYDLLFNALPRYFHAIRACFVIFRGKRNLTIIFETFLLREIEMPWQVNVYIFLCIRIKRNWSLMLFTRSL